MNYALAILGLFSIVGLFVMHVRTMAQEEARHHAESDELRARVNELRRENVKMAARLQGYEERGL